MSIASRVRGPVAINLLPRSWLRASRGDTMLRTQELISAAGRSNTLQWKKLWRVIKVILTELCISSMSSPMTAPPLGPRAGPGVGNMELTDVTDGHFCVSAVQCSSMACTLWGTPMWDTKIHILCAQSHRSIQRNLARMSLSLLLFMPA